MTGGTRSWQIPKTIQDPRKTILRIALRTELLRTAREIPRRTARETALRMILRTATTAAPRIILRTARRTAPGTATISKETL